MKASEYWTLLEVEEPNPFPRWKGDRIKQIVEGDRI